MAGASVKASRVQAANASSIEARAAIPVISACPDRAGERAVPRGADPNPCRTWPPIPGIDSGNGQIGRASCRDRVGQYVLKSVVGVPVKKKNKKRHNNELKRLKPK